ncbi:MAG: response regulator [Longimicrobiales bacterium]
MVREDPPLSRAIYGEVVEGVTIRQQRSCGDRWLIVSARPLRLAEGGLIGGVAAFSDVTEQRELEAELRRAKLVAEEANRSKSEFLANISHEIRTPLNGVVGMVDLALQTDDDVQRTRFLHGAFSACDALLDIITDILDFSKIEAGRLEVESIGFRLRPMIEDLLDSFIGAAQKKGIELTVAIMPDVPDSLVGDPGRIRQVLRNLLSNAVKFTEHGSVHVRVDRRDSSADAVAVDLAVADTGIGIPHELQERIFEPFQQADASTTRRFGGTGLGLTIVAQLVELLGGRVWLDSEPGCGSTFHVELDLAHDEAGSHTEILQAIDLAGERVLIVDDHEISRVVLHGACTAWRMRPAAVDSPERALEALRDAAADGEPFGITIIDANMPDTDGFELARLIRDDPAVAATTIVMLTSAGRRGDAELCRRIGISAYLIKPVRQSDLLEAILGARIGPFEPGRSLVTRHSIRESREALDVLIAEDNEFNQVVIEEMMRRWRHNVTMVATGAAALETARRRRFDLILMDVHMPEMDGLQATMAIRAYEADAGGHVPIVAMTALAQPADREACIAAGMDDYIAKPLRSAELYQVVRRAGLGVKRPPIEGEAHEYRATLVPVSVDRVRLLTEAGGDEVLLCKLVTTFRAQAASLLERLDTAFARA